MEREITRVLTPSEGALRLGADLILSGRLVAMPTETVYGLGGDATNPEAARRIFQVKGRPLDNPIIVHVSCSEGAREVGRMTPLAEDLARAFWPGPLTLVVPSRGVVPREFLGGLDTVGIRCPSHPVARRLIEISGVPIGAPSANRSGRPSPTDALTVLEDLEGLIPLILDGGPCEVGLESTVVDVTGSEPVILRQGGVTERMIVQAVGRVQVAAGEELLRRSPGTRHRHYAPEVPVLLWDRSVPVQCPPGRVGYVGISDPPFEVAWSVRPRDLREYAFLLFRTFREMERGGASVIVAELPERGEALGDAIRDRLIRASGGRGLAKSRSRC